MVSKLWSVPAMVERSDLIGMLPRRFAQEMQRNFAIDIHEVRRPISKLHLNLMWHVSNERNPGHRWLREAMMSVLRGVGSVPEIPKSSAFH